MDLEKKIEELKLLIVLDKLENQLINQEENQNIESSQLSHSFWGFVIPQEWD